MARIITDQNFLDNIKVGEFSKIIKYVINDEDLSVQIRDNKLIFIIMVEIFLEQLIARTLTNLMKIIFIIMIMKEVKK